MEKHETSCEPMDVDLSINSANNSGILERTLEKATPRPDKNIIEASVTHTPTEGNNLPYRIEEWNVKKYHIVRNTERGLKTSYKFILTAFLVMLLALVIYSISSIECNNNIDLKKLKITLDNRLYGQKEAVEYFIDALSRDDKIKIIFFYGGTGVGKTFTSTLTFKDYWNCSNVYHFIMPSLTTTFSTEKMLGLNICDSSIVVVDDIKYNDVQVKEKITDIIAKSENLNNKLTVILIYNCDRIDKGFIKKCDSTFKSELSQAFEDVKVYKRMIEFKPLTQEILKLCIEDELRDKGVTNLQLQNLYYNFDVTLDGCKGVHKKIKFLSMR